MANLTLTFDARFPNSSGVGQTVDSDLYADIFEAGNDVYKERRVLGSDPNANLIATSDGSGAFYTTTVDVSSYTPGDVTIKWYAKFSGTPVVPYPFVESLTYPFDSQLSLVGIRDYIRNMLGFPATVVELTGDHYRTVIDDTLALYNKWLPYEKVRVLDPTPLQSKFPFPDLPSRGPIDVQFVRKDAGFPVLTNMLFGREFPILGYVDFDLFAIGLSYWETMKRISSMEPEWYWDEPEKTLYLSFGGPGGYGFVGTYHVMIRYYDDANLEDVRGNHFHWFRRYALSQAKKILGRIRGKYSGEVIAPGGRMKLDSDRLLDEAAVEEKELVEEIKRMSHSVPPRHG